MRPLLAALATAALLAPSLVNAQSLRQQVDKWRQQHEREILDEAFALFAIPNVASNQDDIAKNVAFLTQAFAKRGVALTPLRAASGGSPALYGELTAPGATRTVVFYAHYDGQPVAGAGWDHDPFAPKLSRYRNSAPTEDVPLPALGTTVDPEIRIRARSASDDKGPVVAMLAALDAMKALKQQASVNVKFFLEGEEEAGSNHLAEILRSNKDKLAADAWLFFDGPIHVSGTPQIVLGVRGVMGAEVTFYGANRAMHSGHYGNWAPNPAVAVAHFVASLRDREGKVLLPGFYNDVPAISDGDRALARALSTTDDSVRTSLGLARTEADNAALGERIMQPALNIRGIRAGNVGSGASNAVPTSASVSIDFRLVPDQQPARIRSMLEQHLAQLGYAIVRDPNAASRSADRSRLAYVTYDSGYTAVRVPSTSASVQAVKRAMTRSYGKEPYTLPILGGSLPLFHFVEQLGATVITVPTVNADNSQHAPNENLRIGNLWDGIALMTELMVTLGKDWGPRS